MDKKMNFKYFYGTEADQFSFYRIPKALFTNDCFKDLSSDAKILYGLMLDRMSLSIKNQWFDEENRAYIYFSIEDIMELLNCGRNKAVKSLQELDDEKGINGIALALRETHKDDFFSVPEDNPLKEMLETAGEIVSQDSDTEQAYLAFICKRLKLNFRKLSVEERKWLKKIAEKSDLLKNPKPQRGRR